MQRHWPSLLAAVVAILATLALGSWWLLGDGGRVRPDSNPVVGMGSGGVPERAREGSQQLELEAPPGKDPPAIPDPSSAEESPRPGDPEDRRAQVARAPLRGRVVDLHSGDPIHDAYVRIRQGARVETRLVEEDGSFVTARDYEIGPLEVTVTQPAEGFRRPLELEFPGGRGPTQVLEHLRSHAPGDERTLRVATGPSVPLRIDPPEALAGWTFEGRLVDRAPGGAAWPWVPLGLEGADGGAPVPGQPVLARLHYYRSHVPEALGSPAFVEIRADGDWSGEVAWVPREGPAPEALEISLLRFGRLEGRVLDGIETPYAGAGLSLVYEGDGQGWEHTESDPWGRFEFAGLRAGSYRLVVRAPERPSFTVPITIRPGENHTGDLRLRELQRAGSIAGAVHVRGFDGELFMSVRLTSRNGGAVERTERSGPITFAGLADDQRRWDFEFADLPVGSYSLEVFTVPELGCRSRIQRALAPAKGIEFLCTASTGFDSIAFRPRTPDGEPIHDAMVMLQMDECWVPSPLGIEFGEVAWQTPRGSPTRWILGAEGHRPVAGGLSDFTRREDGTLVADVVLEPGWSAILMARDAAPLLDSFYEGFLEDGMASFRAPPIEGATVYADGRPVGTTDQEGLVTVLLDEEPRELTIRKPGWTYFGSDELVDGVLTGDRTPAVMWMRR